VWPLFAERRATSLDTDIERQELETEKGRLLQEIHELELDFATGKLSDEDHAAIDARLKGRAIEVMKRLDALTSQTRPGSQHRGVRGEKSYTGSEVGITR
jgi:hypothetical protein